MVCIALVGLTGCAAEPPPAAAGSSDAGVALGLPIYLMEFHLWYHAPFGPDASPGWVKGGLDRNEVEWQSLGPDWLRNRYQVGQPLIGYYESGDPEVLRWQLRCIKATGVAGVFVHLWADPRHPETFLQLPAFERLLTIAAQEGVQVAIHDEVQYRDAACKDALARRAGAALARYGSAKAYLHIAGRPAYAFQWWRGLAMEPGGQSPWPYPAQSPAQLAAVLAEADRLAGGPAHWIPFHAADDQALLAVPQLGSLVAARTFSNQVQVVAGTRDGDAPAGALRSGERAALPPAFSAQQCAELAAAKRTAPTVPLGCWVYAGFNDSTGHAPIDRRSNAPFRWIPRDGGATLSTGLQAARAAGVDFVMVTSWNDWEENTSIEPGAWSEDDDGDPYRYCRVLATAAGTTFVPPPLPPKEAVDPWMWQRLYGIDRTPPHVTRLRYLPLDSALVAEVVDSASAVSGLALLRTGELWAGVVGTDGTCEGDGLTMDPHAAQRDGGLVVTAGAICTVAIDQQRLATSGDWWLAIEYADRTTGQLRIDHPCRSAMVDAQPGDEQTTQLCTRIPLTGDGQWRATVVRLRAVVAGDHPQLVLRLAGADGSVKSGHGELLVHRLHLFLVDGAAGVPGREIAGTAPSSQVKSYRVEVPQLWTGPAPTTVFLVASDAAGNRSAPLAVCGAQLPTTLGNGP